MLTCGPGQVSCGSSLGSEIDIHTLRQWCDRNTCSDKVLLQIDFNNAFSCMSRSSVLREVREHCPRLVHQPLLTIDSLAGVQQGDPLGPLFFSLAVQPRAQELVAQGRNGRSGEALDLIPFYLDDGVVRGPSEAVAGAIRLLRERSAELGLSLNLVKCELV